MSDRQAGDRQLIRRGQNVSATASDAESRRFAEPQRTALEGVRVLSSRVDELLAADTVVRSLLNNNANKKEGGKSEHRQHKGSARGG
jgi:hypothetical protein